MNAGDQEQIDGLLWLEEMGLTNWVDRAQLEDLRGAFPEYFKLKGRLQC